MRYGEALGGCPYSGLRYVRRVIVRSVALGGRMQKARDKAKRVDRTTPKGEDDECSAAVCRRSVKAKHVVVRSVEMPTVCRRLRKCRVCGSGEGG